MSLSIYNSLTRKKELFRPVKEKKVTMYVCGPTVYDYLHVGNFRGSVFFNMVRSWLEELGYKVIYVFNYTDVDDKVIEASKKEKITASEVADKYIKAFEEDYKCLGLKPHDHNPRITEFMGEIISFIEDLLKQDKAYVVKTEHGKDVFYDIKAFRNYGRLSNKKIEELARGVRIDISEGKKNPSDFVLWKSAKQNEPFWDSPWGRGRPGWHIECSTMSQALLGDEIDIHGGGLDLIFPHHENEIAQSEGRTQKTFVRYWMHHNMLDLKGEKMSKSLGNLIKGRVFFRTYDSEVYKYMILSSHYRSVIDFSEKQIHIAINRLARIYSALKESKESSHENKFDPVLEKADKGFKDALNDDFNTVEALARVFEVIREFNKLQDHKKTKSFYTWLVKKGELMSLFQRKPHEYLQFLDNFLLKQKELSRQNIEKLIQERLQARKEKNYILSDKIRNKLTNLGILVKDLKDTTVWEVKK